MNAFILTTLLSLPLYPVNPTEQDTLSLMNLHMTAGFAGPNNIIGPGPEFTAKYEILLSHPYVIRSTVEYKRGDVKNKFYPDGKVNTITFALEGIYYRGTDFLTGYFGAGAVYVINRFGLSGKAADSLQSYYDISDVRIKDATGYRITLGLRYNRFYSLEIGVTEIKTNFIFIQDLRMIFFLKP